MSMDEVKKLSHPIFVSSGQLYHWNKCRFQIEPSNLCHFRKWLHESMPPDKHCLENSFSQDLVCNYLTFDGRKTESENLKETTISFNLKTKQGNQKPREGENFMVVWHEASNDWKSSKVLNLLKINRKRKSWKSTESNWFKKLTDLGEDLQFDFRVNIPDFGYV